MKKEQQVQIDGSLFVEIVNYFECHEDDRKKYMEDSILNQLNEKVDKMLARMVFGEYKTSKVAKTREEALQEYLDLKGVPKDFRGKL